MKPEDIKKLFEALGGANINVAGDFVLEKNNTYTIEKVEAGGIGMQFVSGKEKKADSDETNAPVIPPNGETNPVKSFVDRVKLIMKNAEKDNGKEKPIKARGNGGTYIYNVDGDGFCGIMDDLLLTHEKELADYLKGASADTATNIKYVAPFIGFILDTHYFTHKDMPKNAFQEAFESVYGEGTSAVSKMSDKEPPEENKKLFEVTQEIINKHKTT